MNTDQLFSAACQAHEQKDYLSAERFWQRIQDSGICGSRRASCLNGYGYTLSALRKYETARQIYAELYEETGSHVWLHQLCMVEREAGDYQKALIYIDQERPLIP